MTVPAPPFAVHIADGVLTPPWQVGGFLLMAVGVALALWRIDEREIPRVGVLTAAFFVASQFHIPFGVISVHLLLNGLAGVILRHRVPLAVAVGLTLQYLLFAHGGGGSLGVNFAVLGIPALFAGFSFRWVRWLTENRPRLQSVFLIGFVLGFYLAAVATVVAWVAVPSVRQATNTGSRLDPVFVAGLVVGVGLVAGSLIAAVATVVAWVAVPSVRQATNTGSRLDPVFVAGLVVGTVAASLTVLLNAAVLYLGSVDPTGFVAGVSLVAHLPVIVIEGLGVGFACRVLAKAKPEWLGMSPP